MNMWDHGRELVEMNKLFKDKAVVLLTLYMIAVCIYIVVVRPGNMHDASYWLYRIGALADEMSIKGLLHALPPRILSVTFNGYGYGAPLFYCDVFLWVPALLVLLGMSEMTSFVLLCAVIWGARAAVAAFSANIVLKQFPQVKNRQELSVLFAFAYSCFPYMIEVLLIRGAIGESIAGIFFPLTAAMLFTISHAAHRNPKHVILLALSLSGIVCSHTVSIVIAAGCVVVYLLENWKLFWREPWRFLELLKAGMLSAGLSAFWLFPFIEQYFSHILPEMEGWAWHNVVSFSDWFISYYHVKDRLVWYPSTFGIPLVVWTLLYIIQSKRHANRQICKLLLISWLLCIFMTSRTAMKAVEDFMGFMQFSWRLLSVVALLLSIVIVLVVSLSTKKKWIFGIVCTVYAACFVLSDSAWFRVALLSDTSAVYGENNADGLYIPQGGALNVSDVRGELVDTNLPELVFEWERVPGAQLWLKYSNNTGNAVVQLPLYYYKGYEAYDLANQSRLHIEKGDVGLIWVHLDPYQSGEVVVSYAGTGIQKGSNVLSLLTWMLLAAYMFKKYLKARACV